MYNCEICGKAFKSYSKSARFCSTSCNGKRPDNMRRMAIISRLASKAPRKKRTVLGRRCKCKACGIDFRSLKKKTYCKQHEGKYFKGKKIEKPICTVCGEEYEQPTYNKRKTCSVECKSKALTESQKGDKSHRWQGGKTSEAMIIRNSKEYKDWRTSVFERDDYICQFCGVRGGKLNADHIKPFSTHPDLRLDIDNGRTLCFECHLKTDTWGVKARKPAR